MPVSTLPKLDSLAQKLHKTVFKCPRAFCGGTLLKDDKEIVCILCSRPQKIINNK